MRASLPIRLCAYLSLIALGALIAPPASHAATTGTVQGTVKSAASAPLKGADVTLVGAGLTTTTDKNGYYVFTGVQPGAYTVRAALITFDPVETPVTIQQDITTTLDFSLTKKTISTGKSRIIATPIQRTDTSTQYTVTAQMEQMQKTNPNDLYIFSGLVFGEPGITRDGTGNIHIRGADQNQAGYELDGVPLSEPISNQFGTNTVSVGLKSLNLYTGGADASYDDSLGGYINEVTMNGKDFRVGDKLMGGDTEYTSGPDNGWNYEGTRDEFGGILPNGKLDYYLSTIMFKNDFPNNTQLSGLPSSFDGLGKLNYYVDPKNTVTFFAGQGFEDYDEYQPFAPGETTHYTNGALSAVDTGTFQQDHQTQHYWLNYISFKHDFSPKSFLSYRYYRLSTINEVHAENTLGDYEYESSEQPGSQLDYTNQVSPNYQLKAGLFYLPQKTNLNIVASLVGAPMLPLATDPLGFYYDVGEKVQPTRTEMYLTNQIKAANNKLTMDLGARFGQDDYKLNAGLPSYTDHYIDPRLGAVYSPSRDFLIRTSYSVYSQFPEAYFIEALPPGELGDPITALPGLGPTQAAILNESVAPLSKLGTEHDNDYDLGIEKAFNAVGGAYTFSATGFSRKYYDENQLVVPASLNIFPQLLANGGHGHASGFEMQLKKRKRTDSDWNGWVSYTNQVIKATSSFIDTFYIPYYYQAFNGDPQVTSAQMVAGDNAEYPTSYDQRHTIAAVATKKVNKWLEVDGIMDAGSGYPFQDTLLGATSGDAQHGAINVGNSNLFGEVPVTLANQSTLQPFNPTPGVSGWHYKFSINTKVFVTQDTTLFFNVDNVFDSKTVLIYGTNPLTGGPFYTKPTPQYPQGEIYYGPREILTPLFISFGIRRQF